MLKMLDHIKVGHCWWCFWTGQRVSAEMKECKKRGRLGYESPEWSFFSVRIYVLITCNILRLVL